jgi:eukaryotic-like serine/threonine-protein kinase
MKTISFIIVLCLFAVSAFAQSDAVVSTFHATQIHDGVYSGADYNAFGEVKWRFATEGKVFASPAVYQGVTYVGSADGNLYAIDNKSGALRWKFTTGGAVHSRR